MDLDDINPWKLLGTIAGCIAVDVGIRALYEFAKNRGREELLEELENEGAYVKRGGEGEPVIVVVNGEEFYLAIEPVNK